MTHTLLASAGDAYSMTSFATQKKAEEALKQAQRQNQELKLELQQAHFEVKFWEQQFWHKKEYSRKFINFV